MTRSPNPPISSPPVLYRYPLGLFVPGFIFGGAGLCLVIGLFIAIQQLSVEIPILVYFVLLFGAVLNVGIAVGPVLLLRPLSIDDTKVTSYFWGRSLSDLAWKDVVLIEKIRTYNSYKRKYWFIYIIRSFRTKIRFQDGLRDLDILVQGINQRASQYQIPLEFVDRGDGARSMVAASGSRPDQCRRIFGDGIRTRIEAL